MHCISLCRLSSHGDANYGSSNIETRSNVNYPSTTPPSHSATVTAAGSHHEATVQGISHRQNPNYTSCRHPVVYETITDLGIGREQQRQEEGRCEIPISERYEFAEIHSDTDRRVQVEMLSLSEEVDVGHEQYSHLQHPVWCHTNRVIQKKNWEYTSWLLARFTWTHIATDILIWCIKFCLWFVLLVYKMRFSVWMNIKMHIYSKMFESCSRHCKLKIVRTVLQKIQMWRAIIILRTNKLNDINLPRIQTLILSIIRWFC